VSELAEPERFEIRIPDADLRDLGERLSRTRWAADFANDDWRYGTRGAYLQELVAYWRDAYDWRAHEAAINEHEHYRLHIDGIPIHFLRARGVGPDPVPLILTHGWPWTFWDYRHLIGPLSDPAAHGGDPADAFDVVVPSLPGFGFSSPLETRGVHWGRVAELWLVLMRDVLGFDRFAAQGGDWGGMVAAELGHRFPDHLRGVHVTMPGHPALGFPCFDPQELGPGEETLLTDMQTRMETATSHMAVHSNDPQTLAHALEDSPVGLAAWLVERRRAWSDCNGDLEVRFSKDDLLTTISLYWFTRTIGSSMRFYWENQRIGWQPAERDGKAIPVPTGVAVFPRELVLLPRAVAERNTNLVQWTVMPSGGHFAPAEEPGLLIDDIRSCFRQIR
jgi:pimeloyl-ACP methyl ester carboxylesterase